MLTDHWQQWPELAKIPRVTIQAKSHDGREATYDGVPLIELLKMAGVQFGEKLRGKALANYLVAEGADGYRAVFALPEIDSAFNDRVIILADKRNGQPLAPNEAPWRLVVVGEKREARWVRQLTAIHIRQSQ